jgi:hypothetical protein
MAGLTHRWDTPPRQERSTGHTPCGAADDNVAAELGERRQAHMTGRPQHENGLEIFYQPVRQMAQFVASSFIWWPSGWPAAKQLLQSATTTESACCRL